MQKNAPVAPQIAGTGHPRYDRSLFSFKSKSWFWLFLGWTADDIATIENQEDVLKALIQYGRSMGTKVGVNMVMDTTDANRGEMNSSSTVYGEQEVDDQGKCNEFS